MLANGHSINFLKDYLIKPEIIVKLYIPQLTQLKSLIIIKKQIIFAGKLNSSKGYDLFGNTIIKVLNKHKDWNAVVVGNEPREKFNF